MNPSPEAGEAFRDAAEAYEVLSDPQTRARYDRFGHEGIAGTQFHTEQFMDFSALSDILGAFFGDDVFGGRRRQARGRDAAATVELTLAEAAFGVDRTVAVELIDECERCAGTGQIQHVAQTAFGQFVQTASCAACGGRGVRIEHPCADCRGRGLKAVPRDVDVKIPAGIADGQRLRLVGRGHHGGPGTQPGDLYVGVAVAEDARFHRDGNDLVSMLDLPFSQAALGAEVTVETLDGPERVEIRAGCQPGEEIVLHGKGIGILNGRGRGDHRVVVNVLVPRRLTEQQRELLRRFEESVDDDTYAGGDGFFGRLRAAFR